MDQSCPEPELQQPAASWRRGPQSPALGKGRVDTTSSSKDWRSSWSRDGPPFPSQLFAPTNQERGQGQGQQEAREKKEKETMEKEAVTRQGEQKMPSFQAASSG